MDSILSHSKFVPSNVITGRRHRVSISGSGSYQSHLSSLLRVRTASEQVSLGTLDSGKDYLHILEGGLGRPRVGRLGLLKQFVTDPVTFLSDDLWKMRNGRFWSPWTMLTLYCFFCMVYCTIDICAFSLEAFQIRSWHRWPGWTGVPNRAEPDIHSSASPSPLVNVTLSQRLSIVFRELPPQARLDTFVVANPGNESDLTACLWIEDDARLDEALASAAAWRGPASLVVVTTHMPGSSGYETVLGRLALATAAAAHASATRTSVHVLYVPSVAGGSSNAYLNMARFFAPTSRVVLFPDGIPKAVLAHARWRDEPPDTSSHVIVMSNASVGRFPPRSLVPVVMPRDHPLWCTERVYLFGSRALDWQDCLWRLWLESAGEVTSVVVPHVLDVEKSTATALAVSSSFAIKIRLRWSAKYKSEACAFALKRSQTLEIMSKTEKRHMQWRKKFCRETVGLGALDMALN